MKSEDAVKVVSLTNSIHIHHKHDDERAPCWGGASEGNIKETCGDSPI